MMKHKTTIAALALAIIPAPAMAAPVYLHCPLQSRTADAYPPIEVTLDEEAGRATILITSSGYTIRSRADFTANTVLFSDGVENYRLSRINLIIMRGEPGRKRFWAGQCTIQQPAGRAF